MRTSTRAGPLRVVWHLPAHRDSLYPGEKFRAFLERELWRPGYGSRGPGAGAHLCSFTPNVVKWTHIVAAVGVAQGTFRLYFPNRKAVLFAFA